MNNVIAKSKQNLPSGQKDKRERKQIDKQLTIISFILVLIYITSNTMNAGYAVHNIITIKIISSADRAAMESFIEFPLQNRGPLYNSSPSGIQAHL